MCDQADPAARAADAGELARRPVLVRCEHHSEDRADDIEAAIVEGQILRVAGHEVRLEAVGLGPAPSADQSDGTKSRPTTRQPRRAAAIAALPLPVATSSTYSVECTSRASISSSDTIVICVPIMW